jgi:hypothetical protein
MVENPDKCLCFLAFPNVSAFSATDSKSGGKGDVSSDLGWGAV